MANDMDDAQRKAARGALGHFPALKVDITRNAGSCVLTPYAGNRRGSGVTVIYGATAPGQIAREFGEACANLMAEQ